MRGKYIRSLLVASISLLTFVLPSGGIREVQAAPPQDFASETLMAGFSEPTALAFAPDGRLLIAERFGRIRIARPPYTSPLPTPLLQITNINTSDGERGLVGLALDPNFAANGFLYAFYTAGSPLRDRVSRFTASGDAVVPGSELVLWEDNVAAELWHHAGGIGFGPDGRLYIATGDGFDTSSGSGHVSQRLNSYRGKILRINPDGSIPADNPWASDGNPNTYDAIWARGLRNPFRFSFDPQTNRMLIGDVGGNIAASSIEEIDLGVAGANYGWPICEGYCSTPGMTNPIFSYSHDNRDASIICGMVYRGGNFPAPYQGALFYGDYVQNWIRTLTFDGGGSVIGGSNFEPANGAMDGPFGEVVDIKQGPDGAIYYADLGMTWEGQSNPGKVRRIRFVGVNQPPVITAASAVPNSGSGPQLPVTFSAAAYDPEGQPLTYAWTFGDGGTSDQQNPAYTYLNRGRYYARLSASDGTNATLSDPITITIGSPPVARIDQPLNGATFRAGDLIAYSGTATDPDEVLALSGYSWRIVFLHLSHSHPEAGPLVGITSGTYGIPTTGHEIDNVTAYQIILTVTDSDGIQSSDAVTIYPQTVDMTFDTSPPGLALNFDQETGLTAPFSRNRAIGFSDVIAAPLTQTIGSTVYEFVSWSDGGVATHAIVVPPASQSFIAVYAPAVTPTNTPAPVATPSPVPDLIFADGFESATLSAWSSSVTDGGNLSPSAQAALVEGIGMQALINDNNALYVIDDRPNAEPRYRARFYFDPNSIAMANGKAHYVLYGFAGASNVILRLEFERKSNQYRLRASLRNDANNWSTGSWVDISDAAHAIELDWRAATAAGANNGGLTMWIDGVQSTDLTGVDNDTRRVDAVWLGAVAEIDTATRGTYFFDAFESRRQSYIGLATPSATPTPSSTPTLVPTAAATATPTLVPTAAATATPTLVPTAAATATPTLVPTAAATATPTQTPSPTNTPVSTPTSTSTPAATSAPTSTSTLVPTPPPGSNFALAFDGSNDTVMANRVVGVGPLTIELWVRPTSANAAGILVAGADDTTGWSLELNGGRATLWVATSQGWRSAQHTTALQAGQWYHVAATYSSSTAQVFLNGAAGTSTNVGAGLTQGPWLRIGGLSSGYPYFNGRLDDIRISNVVRYSAAFTPQAALPAVDANTLGLWRFNEGAGQVLVDESSFANVGSLGTSPGVDAADPVWIAR